MIQQAFNLFVQFVKLSENLILTGVKIVDQALRVGRGEHGRSDAGWSCGKLDEPVWLDRLFRGSGFAAWSKCGLFRLAWV